MAALAVSQWDFRASFSGMENVDLFLVLSVDLFLERSPLGSVLSVNGGQKISYLVGAVED